MTDNANDSDSVAALLQRVGRRPDPPREDYERVLAGSREAWRATVRRRGRRRVFYALAAGVAAIALAFGVVWQLDRATPDIEAGKLAFVNGGVFAGDTAGDDWRWLNHAGMTVHAGARLRTDPTGRAALTLGADTSLRVAPATDLLLQAANRIELLGGRLYVDTRGRGSVEVVTRFGTLRDVGTQFEVLATPEGLRVRTREGAVELVPAGSSGLQECAVSEELRIDASGRIERGHISPYDEQWDWVQVLAEPPRGEQLPLPRFLDWVARETGRRLRYDSAETQARVSQVILHGTTRGLSPVQALEAALATTDFDYLLQDDGTILLRSRRRP